MRSLKKTKASLDTQEYFVAITSFIQDLYQQYIAYHIRIWRSISLKSHIYCFWL